jgi:hypothetical protein
MQARRVTKTLIGITTASLHANYSYAILPIYMYVQYSTVGKVAISATVTSSYDSKSSNSDSKRQR